MHVLALVRCPCPAALDARAAYHSMCEPGPLGRSVGLLPQETFGILGLLRSFLMQYRVWVASCARISALLLEISRTDMH